MAIIGDIAHSRVARSNVHLLSKFGAEIVLCGPASLLPVELTQLAPGVRLTTDIRDAIQDADVVMMLRVQKERLVGLNIDTQKYITHYQLTADLLRLAKEDAILMHPGPMVRGMEIQSELAESPQAVIEEQVHNGVFVRMAILALCTGMAK